MNSQRTSNEVIRHKTSGSFLREERKRGEEMRRGKEERRRGERTAVERIRGERGGGRGEMGEGRGRGRGRGRRKERGGEKR